MIWPALLMYGRPWSPNFTDGRFPGTAWPVRTTGRDFSAAGAGGATSASETLAAARRRARAARLVRRRRIARVMGFAFCGRALARRPLEAPLLRSGRGIYEPGRPASKGVAGSV